MKNAINWFEIPVKKFDRAKKFYETIMGVEINVMPHPQMKYGMFPYDTKNGGIGGAIVESEGTPLKIKISLFPIPELLDWNIVILATVTLILATAELPQVAVVC